MPSLFPSYRWQRQPKSLLPPSRFCPSSLPVHPAAPTSPSLPDSVGIYLIFSHHAIFNVSQVLPVWPPSHCPSLISPVPPGKSPGEARESCGRTPRLSSTSTLKPVRVADLLLSVPTTVMLLPKLAKIIIIIIRLLFPVFLLAARRLEVRSVLRDLLLSLDFWDSHSPCCALPA